MNVRSQKQIAAKIMKIGVSRVRVKGEKEVEEAITRNDIRTLITRGVIYKTKKKGIKYITIPRRMLVMAVFIRGASAILAAMKETMATGGVMKARRA